MTQQISLIISNQNSITSRKTGIKFRATSNFRWQRITDRERHAPKKKELKKQEQQFVICA